MRTFAHGSGVRHAALLARLILWVVPWCAVFWPAGCSHNTVHYVAQPGAPTVRVLLLENVQQVDVSATVPPFVRLAGESTSQQLGLSSGTPTPISLTPSGWQIGGAQLGGGEMILEPAADGSVRVGKHTYHGRFLLVPVSPGHFHVINEVDLEGYLCGVLRSELFPSWRDEAYKAQAIVARTYAMYEARVEGPSRGFDLYSDTRSQVYGGIEAETPRSISATQATAGVVVAWGPAGRETIFKAYFSSCCGGVAQSAFDAFGDPDIQPLSGQLRGPVCTESPKFNWGPIQIPRLEVTRRLRVWGTNRKQPLKDMGLVTQMEVQSMSPYGRPTRFRVSDERGYRYSIRAEDFREAVNTDAGSRGTKIYSSNFKPVIAGDNLVFTEGHGYGHGVGMCQWCAQHEAVSGWSSEQIVLSAYPGARLVRAY
jgi:stage II sporulation protein D